MNTWLGLALLAVGVWAIVGAYRAGQVWGLRRAIRLIETHRPRPGSQP